MITKFFIEGALPFPLPGGTVNIHIRRGNKYGEMDYVPVSKYVAAYHNIIALQPLSYARRWVHLSSDTLSVMEEAKNELVKQNSTAVIVYSKMPRMDKGFNHNDWNDFVSNNKTHATMLLLMEMMMALEADSWIGTRISCWGRIIDMLRCVWTDKCNAPFVEVGALDKPDPYMYHEFVVPGQAQKTYGKQKRVWDAPPSRFRMSHDGL